MVKKTFILLSLFLLIILSSCKKDNSIEKESMQEFSGYLMDVTCGNSKTALDKSDVINSPQDHSVACLNVCASSGYGIMTLEEGKSTYKFTAFDDKGTELALDLLKNTKKDKGISIEVYGVLENDIIKVGSIAETN